MTTKRSKPSRTKKTAESGKSTRDSLSARGLHVSYDWELNHVPAALKNAAEIEKVRRQAAQKDYGHTLAEAAKILGATQAPFGVSCPGTKTHSPCLNIIVIPAIRVSAS